MWGHATNDEPALSFDSVLKAEIQEIHDAREARGSSRGQRPSGDDVYAQAHQSRFAGLSFSGGGIRSATFNLGVLQGLAELGLLEKVDYLSTVSGGGYIGSWLATWCHRVGIDEVVRTLRSSRVDCPKKEEPREIEFLREYSNYLTPRRGLFSLDTWTLVGIYLRNLSLNLVILILALMALLVAPRLLVNGYFDAALLEGNRLPIFAWLLFNLAIGTVVLNLATLTRSSQESFLKNLYGKPAVIEGLAILPILVGSWLLGAWLWRAAPLDWSQVPSRIGWWSLIGSVAYTSIWVVGWVVAGWKVLDDTQPTPQTASETAGSSAPAAGQDHLTKTQKILKSANEARQRISAELRSRVGESPRVKFAAVISCAAVAGFLGGLLLLVVACILRTWNPLQPGWHSAVWSMPLVLLVLMVAATAHVGLVGRSFTEDEREWWGRLGAAVFMHALVIAGLGALAAYGPLAMEWIRRSVTGWVQVGLVSGWLATTGLGLLAGRSPKTGGDAPSKKLEWIGRVAPYAFVLGLLLLLTGLTQALLPASIRELHRVIHETAGPTILDEQLHASGYALAHWRAMDESLDTCLYLFALGLVGVALVISWRVGVNEFSMHALYRNRLARCYFGASNRNRSPNPFTGFDPDDDNLRLDELALSPAPRPEKADVAQTAEPRAAPKQPGPYPILNTALNLVGGHNLAWQQRKALSFVFTPMHCGYHVVARPGRNSRRKLDPNGYRPSSAYAERPSLATAMAISGAAASPNMGYHSSAPLAFLMTVFNVRLGWWLGNTRHPTCWRKAEPSFGLFYLLFELFGRTDEERGYVYLSDGGHFENLGLYELVRRRCHLIVVCDSGEDHDYKFGDLGNAIEKCRADFGINIVDLDLDTIGVRDALGRSSGNYALGRILYSDADGSTTPDGILLYVKGSITGEEPVDVRSYRAEHQAFPHEPTSDQWFDEPQFESYRALGHHIAKTVLGAALSGPETEMEWSDQIHERLRAKAAAIRGPGTSDGSKAHPFGA